MTTTTRTVPGLSSTSTAYTLADGSLSVRSADEAEAGSMTSPVSAWPVFDPTRPIDAFRAIQLAMFDLLSALRPYSFDLLEHLRSGAVSSREMRIQRVFFDWATADDDKIPLPSAVIRRDGPGIYDGIGLSNSTLEDTVDQFGEGTVLQRVGNLTQPIEVVIGCANNDDRAGVRSAIEDMFLCEPLDLRPGRRVLVPLYFGRVVELTMTAMAHESDSAAASQGNDWSLQARFNAEVNVVRLVTRPGLISGLSTDVSVSL